jgi:hypothetical protein
MRSLVCKYKYTDESRRSCQKRVRQVRTVENSNANKKNRRAQESQRESREKEFKAEIEIETPNAGSLIWNCSNQISAG